MKRFCIKSFRLFILSTSLVISLTSFTQVLDGFTVANKKEQVLMMPLAFQDVTIEINAPLHFNKNGKTFLILYALPNGNSIEWTRGKKITGEDDWHFDIQHIAAQTRFVRSLDKKNNYIIAYLMANQKSWPAWKRTTEKSISKIQSIVDSLTGIFRKYDPKIILNGHSGGGSFIFGYLDAAEYIPGKIERICFLDSNYGYEDSLHTQKLVNWLRNNKRNQLFVLAYNDSIVIYNGKPLVSPTGGTWYRSRLMQRKLADHFSFTTNADTAFMNHAALNGRIRIVLKENPAKLIYHTVQVEKNGFIFSLLSNTRFDSRKYFTYFGDRAYEKYIE